MQRSPTAEASRSSPSQ